MSLLNRIAISSKGCERKDRATQLIAQQDDNLVTTWLANLAQEIEEKIAAVQGK